METSKSYRDVEIRAALIKELMRSRYQISTNSDVHGYINQTAATPDHFFKGEYQRLMIDYYKNRAKITPRKKELREFL